MDSKGFVEKIFLFQAKWSGHETYTVQEVSIHYV